MRHVVEIICAIYALTFQFYQVLRLRLLLDMAYYFSGNTHAVDMAQTNIQTITSTQLPTHRI